MKFLVVDDSPTMRRIVNNSLKGLGYTDVIEAEDGKDALAKIEGIDFIITDWNMPVMTGLEFTKAVRADDKYKHLPILMVTTRGVKDDIVEALTARVNNYVVKPFTPQVLKEKIDTIIKSITIK
jgi:two-component system, chemotaxis family, chemotaxis protein CheY